MADRSERVRRYFDAQAAGYAQRSGGWLWRKIREREAAAILEMLQPQPGEQILDAGSGSGYYSELLLNAGAHVTALDYSEAMLENLKVRLPQVHDTIQADLTQCELPSKFDKVLCAGALEFVSDPAAAVANLLHALNPTGPRMLVIHAPADTLVGRVYRLFHRRHGFGVHLWAKKSLDSLLAKSPDWVVARQNRVLFNHILLIRPGEPTT